MNADDDRDLRALEWLDTAMPPPAAAPITPATLRRRLHLRRARAAATLAAAAALLFCSTRIAGDTSVEHRDAMPPAVALARDLAALQRRVDALLADLTPVPDLRPHGRAELRLQLAFARARALSNNALTTPDPTPNHDRAR